MMYQSLLLTHCPSVLKANSTSDDVSITFVAGNDLISPCGSIQHLSFVILLLVLYPLEIVVAFLSVDV